MLKLVRGLVEQNDMVCGVQLALKRRGLCFQYHLPTRALCRSRFLFCSVVRQDAINDTLTALKKEQLGTVLGFILQWNTNSRYSDLAQILLEAVLQQVPPATICAMPDARRTIDALYAYSGVGAGGG